MKTHEIFRAMGDSSRLEMLILLSNRNDYTISTLTKGLNITRQGSRKHLRILEEAELVVLKVEGRETYIMINKKNIDLAKKFIEKLENDWDTRLSKLKRVTENKK